MARPCSVCTHPQRAEIDLLLATGTPSTQVAERYGLVDRSVRRHAANHLPLVVQEAARADEEARNLDVLTEVKRLYGRAVTILDGADDDPGTALRAIREARETLALVGRLLGELDERPVVNVLVSQQWVEVRAVLLSALSPYPEARAAAASALLEAGGGQ